ncbi:MAG: hypothetical protein HYX66_01335 [Ignavibacteria bacterium]|nr:hypothetical protein [Ignavibacteria bacterium]
MGGAPNINVDPFGADYFVSRKGNRITIKVVIKIFSNRASKARAEIIRKELLKKWDKRDGWKVKDSKGNRVVVHFEFDVSLFNDDNPSAEPADEQNGKRDGTNFVKFTDDLAPAGSDPIVSKLNAQETEKPIAGNRSWVDGKSPNFGVWAGNYVNKGTYAHELGHLLGLEDRYEEYTYFSILDFHHRGEKEGLKDADTDYSPHAGWEKNIMGNFSESVNLRNIQQMIGTLPTGTFDGALIRAVIPNGGLNKPKLNNPLNPN